MKIILEGIDITSDIKEFDNFKIEVGLNSATKTITKMLSESVTVTGDTYDRIAAKFFKDCNGINQEMKAVFRTDICGSITIPLTLTSSGMVDIPEKQEAKILFKSEDQEDKIHALLDSTFWFEDFAEYKEIPIVYYADQPGVTQWIILLVTAQVRLIVELIDKLVESVCELATLGFGKCESKLTETVFSALDTWLTGLGRWGTAPLVRDILTFQCQKAGLLFSSSILNDPASSYYNLSLFDLSTGERGSHKDISRNKRKDVLLKNASLWTVVELLNNLAVPFEAEYRIIDGILYFENKDFFYDLANVKLFNTKDICFDDPLEYEFNSKDMVAYGEFRFSQDMDTEGTKALRLQELKLEFNDPYSPAQKGKLSRNSTFAAARFMFDQITYEKSGFWDFERGIDEFRDGPDSLSLSIGGIFYNLFGNKGIIRKNDLILSGNQTNVPKLLVLENNFNINDAAVIKKPYKKLGTKQYWIYNFPMLYKENPDSFVNDVFVPGTRGELASFAELTDPRNRKDRKIIPEIETDCNCDTVNKVITDFQKVYAQCPYGKALPEKASIEFDKSKVKVVFSNSIVFCE